MLVDESQLTVYPKQPNCKKKCAAPKKAIAQQVDVMLLLKPRCYAAYGTKNKSFLH